MTQDITYPDPEQLRKYADEPMPFHKINASNIEMLVGERGITDGSLRWGAGPVEYIWHPTYILVETERDEWERIEDISWYDMDHTDAWDKAIDLQIEEDFICVTEFISESGEAGDAIPHQFDAYWVLQTVTINNPNLYR